MAERVVANGEQAKEECMQDPGTGDKTYYVFECNTTWSSLSCASTCLTIAYVDYILFLWQARSTECSALRTTSLWSVSVRRWRWRSVVYVCKISCSTDSVLLTSFPQGRRTDGVIDSESACEYTSPVPSQTSLVLFLSGIHHLVSQTQGSN